MRYAGPYKASILPLIQGNLGPLEAYQRNRKSGALVLLSNQIVDFFFNEAQRSPIKESEITETINQETMDSEIKEETKEYEEYLYGNDEINYLIEATNRIIKLTDD